MKFIVLAFALMLVTNTVHADQFRGSKICFYDHESYKGSSFCVTPGTVNNDLSRTGWNKRISSIRVFGSGSVVLYKNFNFQGQSQRIDGNWPALARFDQFNDATSSFRTESGLGRACFFEWTQYSGVSLCIPVGQDAPNFVDNHMNDRTNSIRLDGDVSVYAYENVGYAGSMLTVRQSLWDMYTSLPNWKSKISSVKVRRKNQPL